jgi:hypothetical protein
MGEGSLYSNTTGSENTAVGRDALSSSIGASNTGVGTDAGFYITTGSKNTILGRYNGNQHGMDIRTSSNNIVLSDGDGKPQLKCYSDGRWYFGLSSALNAHINLIGEYGTGYQAVAFSHTAGGSQVGSISTGSSSTSYNTSSDYRLKENVIPMSGSIDRLKELKPSRFNFITDPDLTVDGFLAHEVQSIIPEAITGEKDAVNAEEYEVTPAVKDDDDNVITEAVMGEREVPDMQGIDQSKLVPLLVGAIQELTARLEALENS